MPKFNRRIVIPPNNPKKCGRCKSSLPGLVTAVSGLVVAIGTYHVCQTGKGFTYREGIKVKST